MRRYCLFFSLLLLTSSLFAQPSKKETSLFLEYERETAKQSNSAEDANPFVKFIRPISTKAVQSAPAATPTTNITTSAPSSEATHKNVPAGSNERPFLIVNAPIKEDVSKSCQTPIILSVDSPTVHKPKKSLFMNLASTKERVLSKAKAFIGTPYGFGSKEQVQTDCSGFTQQVYKDFGINLPRSAAEQAQLGTDVDIKDLQVGDLMFYQTYKSEPSHVAIYAGDGQIIHASYRNKRVQYDAIDKGYYKQRFMYAKRLKIGEMDTSNE
jgi:cell wall-associated NlpC family hydrolase